MGKWSPFRNEPAERSAIPLVVAICGLVAAVSSFWLNNEDLSTNVFGCGLISAGWCIFYWIVNPKEGMD